MKIKKIKWDTKFENGLLFGGINGGTVVGAIRASKHEDNGRKQTWYYGQLLQGGRLSSPIYTNTVKGISPEQKAKDWVEKEFEKWVSKFLED